MVSLIVIYSSLTPSSLLPTQEHSHYYPLRALLHLFWTWPLNSTRPRCCTSGHLTIQLLASNHKLNTSYMQQSLWMREDQSAHSLQPNCWLANLTYSGFFLQLQFPKCFSSSLLKHMKKGEHCFCTLDSSNTWFVRSFLNWAEAKFLMLNAT